jgi:hypothetical protein
MPKKPKASAFPEPSPAQKERAAGLRSLIKDIASGAKPADAPPQTPRELTDEAARRKWESERKKGKR